ncbi:hypothetical protein [Arthrobacter sp. NPDC089319]|uniref:hypothetical protein n=1 Tax=Arthrobacter sp. NPDC089319 TaxID=3155915 RepID=UPI00343D2592
MSVLSGIFGFSTALGIMLGLAVYVLAVMTPILIRRNRKFIQERQDAVEDS